MKWPLQLPAEMTDGLVALQAYSHEDRKELFDALADDRAWEHIPRLIPDAPAELDAMIQVKLADGYRRTFTIRRDGQVVGITSVLFDPNDASGVEIGGTQLDPVVWGTGVNDRAKGLLLAEIFERDAHWIQFRTDERNARSAAAILKLGARDLGVHQDHRVRRDGTQRCSRLFRLDRPAN